MKKRRWRDFGLAGLMLGPSAAVLSLFVIYPLVIWLVRESLLSRRRRHEEQERITELVRAFATSGAHELDGEASAAAHSSKRAPAHSAALAASCTE